MNDPVETRIQADIQRALTLAHQDRDEEALQVTREILEIDPERAEVLHLRGDILFRLSRNEEAIEALNRARTLAPWMGRPIRTLSRIYLERGDASKARDLMELSLRESPDDPETLDLAAEVLGKLSIEKEGTWKADRARAESFAARLVAENPEDAQAHARFSRVAEGFGKWRIALRYAQEALRLDPEDEELLNLEGRIRLEHRTIKIPFDFSSYYRYTIQVVARRLSKSPQMQRELNTAFGVIWSVGFRSLVESPVWLGILTAFSIGLVLRDGAHDWLSLLLLVVGLIFLLLRLRVCLITLHAARGGLLRRIARNGSLRYVRNVCGALAWALLSVAATASFFVDNTSLSESLLKVILLGLACSMLASMSLSFNFHGAAKGPGGVQANLDGVETTSILIERSSTFLGLRFFCVVLAGAAAWFLLGWQGPAIPVIQIGLGVVILSQGIAVLCERRTFRWAMKRLPPGIEFDDSFKPPRARGLVFAWICVLLSTSWIVNGVIALPLR